MIWLLPTVCLFACVLHLYFAGLMHQKLALKTKLLASLAFIGFAWDLGAWDSAYGQWLFIGLVAAMIGDVLLGLKSHKNSFIFGIGAFLITHFLYFIAFFQLGFNTAKLPLIIPVIATTTIITMLWLRTHLQGIFVIIVPAYLMAISTMLTFAWCNESDTAFAVIVSGATMFAISDLFVARNRFVKEQNINKTVGLPLYYMAQLVLAYSVSMV